MVFPYCTAQYMLHIISRFYGGKFKLALWLCLGGGAFLIMGTKVGPATFVSHDILNSNSGGILLVVHNVGPKFSELCLTCM